MTATELILGESRAARRLARLFKIERHGGFHRWPAATVRLLIERRGVLVEDLLTLDGIRRSLAAPRSFELECALSGLVREVNQSLFPARARVEQIGGDLSARCGAGLTTGIRDNFNGQLLGKI